jgi:SpoVK/Ycf46/Vps4 family AAA+-type ATPase
MGSDVDLEALAAQTEHYSGADIAVVAKHAAYSPMRHKQAEVALLFPRPEQLKERLAAIKAGEAEVKAQPICHRDLLDAIAANKPSASNDGLQKFEEYARQHGAT